MYEELRKQAKKKVEAKKGFYIAAVTFGMASITLIMLSFYLSQIAFWLLLPVPILLMTLVIVYISVFGLSLPGKDASDWEEQEIQREMFRLYLQKKKQLSSSDRLTTEEALKLKQLETLLNQEVEGDLL